ncbi:MAG: DNA gyrase subunit A [Anaerolineaceae bacterium]|nr:DNA gyrase subunit A [Anaerolineaceae bacterium]
MELGLIRKVDLDLEMQQSYLDYAMSVIVSRALPDARDGLKPVQRRILYAMYDMGLRAESTYKKSARIVGEVLGKYHPHGDMAVYESMARMAQDFSLRYMLVDGQGNFGSVDGDPPAAMRYTEARLAAPAMEMLNQIDKDTVDFTPNFDQSLAEPVVLPAAIPNLLVNGATGIAVGMATNIPPHNLAEVIDALHYMLQAWEKLEDINVEDLLHFIQGPDFPTGGVILQEAGAEGLMSAYGTGRGKITVQARAHLEEMVRGRNRIIVTELPYQVNKASLIERIAELVRGGSLDGVADLRDESDRQGMRIVIELSKTADPEKILRDLYKHTPMQTTYGINLLALVDGEPRLLGLKQALRVYLEHRLVIIRRRSEFDLARAKARAHILEGLLIALHFLDEVIAIIRGSPDAEQARLRLIKRFKLSELQAQAILDMQLRRLASLERKKIEQEHKELTVQIKDLETLLKSPKKMRQVVDEELVAMKQAYGDRRRTLIMRLKEGARTSSFLTTTDITPAQEVWVAVTADGCISRTLDDNAPPVAGRDAPRWLLHTNTHHTLYLVSESGMAAAVPVHSVPEAGTLAEGVAVAKVSPLPNDENLAGMFALPSRVSEDTPLYVLTVTRAGLVKKSQVDELPGPSAHAFVLSKVNDGDQLSAVLITDGTSDLLLATARGMAIRFNEVEIRPMGLIAAGVGGIKLAAEDQVIAGEMLARDAQVLLVTSNGRSKRIPAKDYPVQGRYGQGVVTWKLLKDAFVAGMVIGKPGQHVLVHFQNGLVRDLRLEQAPLTNRASQGTALAWLKAEDRILSLTRLPAGSTGPIETAAVPHKRTPPDVKITGRGDGHPIVPGNTTKIVQQPDKKTTHVATQLPLLDGADQKSIHPKPNQKLSGVKKSVQKAIPTGKSVNIEKPVRKGLKTTPLPAEQPPKAAKTIKKSSEKLTPKPAIARKPPNQAVEKPVAGKQPPTKAGIKPLTVKKSTPTPGRKTSPAKPVKRK